jgi:hypothetical protein
LPNIHWKKAKDKIEASIRKEKQQDLGFIVAEKRTNMLKETMNLDYQAICKGLEIRDGNKIPIWRRHPVLCFLAFGLCDIISTSCVIGYHMDAVVNKKPDLPHFIVNIALYNCVSSAFYLAVGFMVLIHNLDKITRPIVNEFIKDYDRI